MPDNCDACPFCDYEQAKCLASNERGTDETRYRKRMDWCPMHELPEIHGRLIDAGQFEVLSYDSRAGTPCDTFDDGVMWILEKIDQAPTIVEDE